MAFGGRPLYIVPSRLPRGHTARHPAPTRLTRAPPQPHAHDRSRGSQTPRPPPPPHGPAVRAKAGDFSERGEDHLPLPLPTLGGGVPPRVAPSVPHRVGTPPPARVFPAPGRRPRPLGNEADPTRWGNHGGGSPPPTRLDPPRPHRAAQQFRKTTRQYRIILTPESRIDSDQRCRSTSKCGWTSRVGPAGLRSDRQCTKMNTMSSAKP